MGGSQAEQVKKAKEKKTNNTHTHTRSFALPHSLRRKKLVSHFLDYTQMQQAILIKQLSQCERLFSQDHITTTISIRYINFIHMLLEKRRKCENRDEKFDGCQNKTLNSENHTCFTFPTSKSDLNSNAQAVAVP